MNHKTGKLAESGITFVAHQSDSKGVAAIQVLKELGAKTQLISTLDAPDEPHVAIFGLDNDAYTRNLVGGKGFYLRQAAYRLEDIAPSWAVTPLKVAIFRTEDRPLASKSRTPSTFRDAIAEMAVAFANWKPGLKNWAAPWSRDNSPFKSDDEYQGSPITDRRGDFQQWCMKALNIFGSATLPDILNIRLPAPVFEGPMLSAKPNLLFMMCAPFNAPHTDLAQSLLPDKMERVIQITSQLLTESAPHIHDVSFVVADSDFIDHPMLRASLHPFMFLDTTEITSKLNILPERLNNWNHRRTDDEMKAAMRYGRAMMVDQLVEPLRKATGIRIGKLTWTELFGRELLDEAWQIAQHKEDLARKIYFERVELHPWWKTLDKFDRESGLQRLIANMGIYIAFAKFLAANPNHATFDFEVDAQYWTHLKDFVFSEIWMGNVYPIFPMPKSTLQPWGY